MTVYVILGNGRFRECNYIHKKNGQFYITKNRSVRQNIDNRKDE